MDRPSGWPAVNADRPGPWVRTPSPLHGDLGVMVEHCRRWFAELTTKKTKRGAHRSVRELERDIRDWIAHWNENPKPYVWVKPAEKILESISRYCQRIDDSAH